MIGKMMSRHIKNPRHTRSGFPDLTVWNIDEKKVKVWKYFFVMRKNVLFHFQHWQIIMNGAKLNNQRKNKVLLSGSC